MIAFLRSCMFLGVRFSSYPSSSRRIFCINFSLSRGGDHGGRRDSTTMQSLKSQNCTAIKKNWSKVSFKGESSIITEKKRGNCVFFIEMFFLGGGGMMKVEIALRCRI